MAILQNTDCILQMSFQCERQPSVRKLLHANMFRELQILARSAGQDSVDSRLAIGSRLAVPVTTTFAGIRKSFQARRKFLEFGWAISSSIRRSNRPFYSGVSPIACVTSSLA